MFSVTVDRQVDFPCEKGITTDICSRVLSYRSTLRYRISNSLHRYYIPIAFWKQGVLYERGCYLVLSTFLFYEDINTHLLTINNFIVKGPHTLSHFSTGCSTKNNEKAHRISKHYSILLTNLLIFKINIRSLHSTLIVFLYIFF